MAFAHVQTSSFINGVNDNPSTVIFTAGTTKNNIVVVHVKVNVTTTTLRTVTDNVGNSYVIVQGSGTAAGFNFYQAYGVQLIPGATSVTITLSGSVIVFVGAEEYSGGKRTNATVINVQITEGSATVTTTPALSVALVPSSNGLLIVSTITSGGGRTFTAGTNYTITGSPAAGRMRSQYRLSGTTSETSPYTLDTASEWAIIATAFELGIPVVSTLSITNITSTTAITGGINIGGVIITERGVCYNTSGTPTTSDTKVTNSLLQEGEFNVSLTGLTLGTTYYIRAYAINADGTFYGNEKSFITRNYSKITGIQSVSGITSIQF